MQKQLLYIALLLILLFSHARTGLFAQSGPDSLINLLSSENLGAEEKTDIYLKISESYRYSNPDSAIFYGLEGLKIAERNGLQDFLSKFYIGLGDSYMNSDNLIKAMECYQAATDHASLSNDQSEVLDAWVKLGVAQDISTQYAEALTTYNEGLALAEKYKDTISIARFLNNLAIIQDNVGEWRASLRNYKRAAVLYILLGQELELGYCYNNLGLVYLNTEIYDSAQLYYQLALNIFTKYKDYYGLTNANLGLGDLALASDSITNASYYYNTALLASKKMQKAHDKRLSPFVSASVYSQLGRSVFLEKDYKKAKEYLWSAYKLAEKLPNYELLVSITTNLAKLYEEEGQIDSLLYYYKLGNENKDSLYKDKNSQNFARLLYKYDIDKKEQQFDYEKKLLNEQNQRKRVRFLMIIIVVLSLLAGSVSIVLLLRSKLMRKNLASQNLELKNKNLNIELEYKKQELASHILVQVQKNNLIKKIARDLKDILDHVNETSRIQIHSLIIQLNSESDDKMVKEFEKRFKEINNEFYNKLHKKYSGLTTNEKRLCIYIYLNMSTK